MEHEVCAYCGEQISGQPYVQWGKTYCDSTCAEQDGPGPNEDYE